MKTKTPTFTSRTAWTKSSDREALLTGEWLVSNGLGGYASGTIGNVSTRRYHGLLIAALPAPFGRTMMLNQLSEQLTLRDHTIVRLGGEERANTGLSLPGAEFLAEFRVENRLPVWRYAIGDIVLEKRILLPHEQNTVHVHYRLLAGAERLRLKLRPALHFRGHDDFVSLGLNTPYRIQIVENRYEIGGPSPLPPLRLFLFGEHPAFTLENKRLSDILYRVEERRGYPSVGDLCTPGYFRVDVTPDRDATLVASTEEWDTILALSPDQALAAETERCHRLLSIANAKAQKGIGAELALAADQFIISPAVRAEESARAKAAGEEVRTIIAGYHWFTDWGRDTMISLEGLTLLTGRHHEARHILRTFGHYIRDGLIPNMFPEGEKEGLYHTADATLWFFHALQRYTEFTGDLETRKLLLPALVQVVQKHIQGTRFGIGVDHTDGLLRQGQEGYQLTWMDAKVGDWVVTPRRGKAVEINALWFNALRLLQRWLTEENDTAGAQRISQEADRVQQSFNSRFWHEEGGYLYDVIDAEEGGNDAACRPNQLFAIALEHPVLDPSRWKQVVEVAEKKLFTPIGLRSLAPGHPDYKAQYDGDLRARDAAYHQGTVWPWLIGPFIDAWLKVHPKEPAKARKFLEGFEKHLGEACISSVSEIFDAESPYCPRGCIAQAWSVAELLRVLVKTEAGDSAPQ